MHATCHAGLILLGLIILIINVEYKLQSSPLCTFLQRDASSLILPNVPLRVLCTHNLSLCSSVSVQHYGENYNFVSYNLNVST